MALVNVVRYENHPDEVVGKYTEDDIRLDSQLIVYPAQTAFFARGGKILDEFTSGTYTINSENIPLLNKIINLPFGKESPFGAEGVVSVPSRCRNCVLKGQFWNSVCCQFSLLT